MKRTTIYLEPELEVLLQHETRRAGRPMAAIIRDALRAHLQHGGGSEPPGAGAFRSGHKDTARTADRVLRDSGFGRRR